MRILTQGKLNRATRTELLALLRRISQELPVLLEGSQELRNARINLANTRAALARPSPGLRP